MMIFCKTNAFKLDESLSQKSVDTVPQALSTINLKSKMYWKNEWIFSYIMARTS